MISEKINRLTCVASATIVDAMELIDANTKGLLFVKDDENRLVGCITDGDIRRWLISTGDLSAKVSSVMTTTPVFLSHKSVKEAEKIMKRKKITAIPIVDDEKHIVDIILFNDLYSNKTSLKKLSGIPVVVMAGGKGTRLYPYTKILPKPLIPIGDTPIIERIIDQFVNFGADKFYVTVNYKKSMIKSYFGDLNPNYGIVYIEENKPLGTCGSIKLIEEKFDKPFFVTNSDTLVLADYEDIYNYHCKTGNLITIVSAVKNMVVPYGVIHTKKEGEIINIEEKPKLSYLINTGMYVINSEIVDDIPEDTFYHMTNLVEDVMKNGGKVGMYPISEDSFLDMGELGEMKRMEEKLNVVVE